MARRSNGEGSFYQKKDKSWVYQVTYGRKEDGSLYRKAFKGRTKTICKERRAQWEEEQARIKAEEEAQAAESARLEELRAKLGHPIEAEILFSEAFLKWLELYKSPPARKPSTYASYLDTYRIHFAEAFGNLPLYQITQDTIQDYYQRKQKNGGRLDGRKGGLSAKTIQNQHMLLKDFFAYAMRKYHLPCNPTIDTTRPEVITPEMRVLSPSEMQVFIEEVMRETQRVAILTTLFVGFRVGEVLALKISDLDLEKQTLSVTKNLIRVPTAAVSPENPNIEILNYDPKKKTHLIVQNTPKTSTSNREIAISDGLCELLIRHLFTLAIPHGRTRTGCCSRPRPGRTLIPRVLRSGWPQFPNAARSARSIPTRCGTRWQRGWWKTRCRSTSCREFWDIRRSKQRANIFTKTKISSARPSA